MATFGAILSSAHGAAAQSTLLVPMGASIDAAIAAANPGDILQLAGGVYAPFGLTKGVTILGPALIMGAPLRSLDVTIPPGAAGRLVDLDIQLDQRSSASPTGSIRVSSGRVVFDECRIVLRDSTATTLITNAEAIFVNSSIRHMAGSSTPALRIRDADVLAVDSEFFGADTFVVFGATPAIEAGGSRGSLQMSRCLAAGGEGSINLTGTASPTQPAIRSTLDTWLVDCRMEGGSDSFFFSIPGAPAVDLANGVIARTALAPGTGSVTGPGFVGNVTTSRRMIGVQASGPLTLGASFWLSWTAEAPGVPIATAIRTDATPTAVVALPFVAMPLWTVGFTGTGTIVTGNQHRANLSFPVPNVASLRFQTIDWLGFRLDGSIIWAAPPVSTFAR